MPKLPRAGHLVLASYCLVWAAVMAGRPGLCQATASSERSRDGSPGLTETQWNLIEVNGDPVAPPPAGSQPYIYLQEPGDKLSGSGGCNRLFGSFDVSGSSLQFHSVASTLMACNNDSAAHEPALLDALKLATSYQIAGNMLQLKLDDRVVARFQARKKQGDE